MIDCDDMGEIPLKCESDVTLKMFESFACKKFYINISKS